MLGIGAGLLVSGAIHPGWADSASSLDALRDKLGHQERQIREQEARLKRQSKQLAAQKQQLESQKSQFETLRQQVDTLRLKSSDGVRKKKDTAADSEVVEVGEEHRPESKKRPPEVATLVDEGGVLLGKGKLVVEPSVEYSRSSSLRVAIEGFTIIPALNVGSFSVSEVDRDTLTTALALRYGVSNRLEIDAKIPYIYRQDTTLSRPIGAGAGSDVTSEADAFELGDVEVGAHYQITSGKGGWPYLVGNLRFKSITGKDPFEVNTDAVTGLPTELPTGSGFYGIQASLTAIQPSDPAVFFANLGYLYNMERNIGGATGSIDPGDSVSASFGMGLSLNRESSISIGYSHAMVFETTQNGSAVQGSDSLQIGSLDLGYSFQPVAGHRVNLNVGAGLTADSAGCSGRVALSYDLFIILGGF